MPLSRRKVSYAIPRRSNDAPFLELPPLTGDRIRSSRPLLRHAAHPNASPEELAHDEEPHPQHTLGINALALDCSTCLAGSDNPSGILYTSGRDGLVASWSLDLPLYKRQRHSLPQVSHHLDEHDSPEQFQFDDDALNDPPSYSRRRKIKLSIPNDKPPPFEEAYSVDTAALDARESLPHPTFRQAHRWHADWVNDMVLCDQNRLVVTASSDRKIKAWRPHDRYAAAEPVDLGSHADYVKCISYSRSSNRIVSGGLDRRLKLWDLGESRVEPVLDLAESSTKTSIYAAALNDEGNILAAGGPDKILRLWDPKSGQKTSKLGGHTDTIRSILTSQDGKEILTSSSDATIKLWSVAMQRCVHTFSHHCDSVWTLASTHPYLKTFYSGDRAGYVCKVDYSDTRNIHDGDCIVLCKAYDEGKSSGKDGITRIALAPDHSLVYTATGTSDVQIWRDVPAIADRRHSRNNPTAPGQTSSPKSASSEHTPLLRGLPYDSLIPLSASDTLFGPSLSLTLNGSPSMISLGRIHTTQSYSTSPFGHRSMLQMQNSRLSGNALQLSNSPRSGSYPNGFGYLSTTPLMGSKDRSFGNLKEMDEDELIALEDYEHRDSVLDATPLRSRAAVTIKGRHGLIRAEILNDRRHVLSLDTQGDFAVWDICLGGCVGRFTRKDVSSLLRSSSSSFTSWQSTESRSHSEANDLLELIRARIEGEAVLSQWCTVDVKTGALTVHVEDNRAFDCEAYIDECALPHFGAYKEDQRLNIGKWVLKNIFDNFIKEEISMRSIATPARIPTSQSNQSLGGLSARSSLSGLHLNINTSPSSPMRREALVTPGGISVALSTPALTPALPPDASHYSNGTSMLSPRLTGALASIPQSPNISQDSSKQGKDYFNSFPTTESAKSDADATPVPKTPSATTPGGGLIGKMRRWKTSRKMSEVDIEEKIKDIVHDPLPDTPEALQTRLLIDLFSKPLNPPSANEVPNITFLNDVAVMLSEETKDSGAWSVVYRGHVTTTGDHLALLEQRSPAWLLDFLLHNKGVGRDHAKIPFVLMPWSPDSAPLSPGQYPRLSAARTIRMRKVLAYISERVLPESLTPPPPLNTLPSSASRASIASMTSVSSNPPNLAALENEVELLVNDERVPLTATLGVVQKYYFGKSGDVTISYRRISPPD